MTGYRMNDRDQLETVDVPERKHPMMQAYERGFELGSAKPDLKREVLIQRLGETMDKADHRTSLRLKFIIGLLERKEL